MPLTPNPFLSLINHYVMAQRARGLARSSIKTWGAWLRSLARYLDSGDGTQADLADFTTQGLSQWMLALSEAGKRPRTRLSARSAVVSFGDWLVSEQALRTNPAAGLARPKLDAARRDLCSDEEIRDLLDACDRLPSLRRAALARCAISLLVYTACRRNELLALQVGDVNQADQSVLIRNGKGSKARTIYPATDALAAVAGWMRVRGTCNHTYLLDFDHSRRLGDAGLRTLLADVKAVAGLRGHTNILPHSIRHSTATRLMNQGATIEQIRIFLGHSDLATTSLYLHATEAGLRGLAEKGALPAQAPEPAAPVDVTPERRPSTVIMPGVRPVAAWRAPRPISRERKRKLLQRG